MIMPADPVFPVMLFASAGKQAEALRAGTGASRFEDGRWVTARHPTEARSAWMKRSDDSLCRTKT